MMKQEKKAEKAPILLTETELDHVAGGDNADLIADPFNQIAGLLNLPWWAINNDSAPIALSRNRGLLN
jgi:hypothetical protein